MRTSLLLILFVACSSTPKDKETSLAWQGHPLEETSHHPYFKKLRLFKTQKEGLEEWTFRDMSPGNSQGFCDDIGNCRALASLYCDYTFKARNDKIVEMESWGQCPFPKSILIPR